MDNKLLPIPQWLKGQEAERAEIIVFEHLSKGTVGISQALGRMTTYYLPEVYAEISELVDMLSQQITADNFGKILKEYFGGYDISSRSEEMCFFIGEASFHFKKGLIDSYSLRVSVAWAWLTCVFPKTLSDFISDCKRNGILLTWRSE